MNIKTMTVCLVCAGALLVSCGSNREKKAGNGKAGNDWGR